MRKLQSRNSGTRLLGLTFATSCLCALLIFGPATAVDAAGRTYKPQQEDDRILFELCRLKKRDYIDGGTNCIYQRQSGGKDVVIKVDGQKVRCQSEFQCKRI